MKRYWDVLFFWRHFLEQEGISDIVHRSSSSSPHRRVKYFLCGPPSLVHDVRAMLLSFGAKEADIMYERWQRWKSREEDSPIRFFFFFVSSDGKQTQSKGTLNYNVKVLFLRFYIVIPVTRSPKIYREDKKGRERKTIPFPFPMQWPQRWAKERNQDTLVRTKPLF